MKGEKEKLDGALARVRRLRQSAYEDYRDALISREDFLRYRDDYEAQEKKLEAQLAALEDSRSRSGAPARPWVDALLTHGRMTQLDRQTIAETIREIRVFEGGKIEITYLFSDGLAALLEDNDDG